MWYDVDTNERYDDEKMLSMIRDYIEDMDYSDVVDEMLNECYPAVEIAGERFNPADVLKELNPDAYEEVTEVEKEYLYNEIEYVFKNYFKYIGETLTEHCDSKLNGYFADCYVWKEE